MDNKANCLFIAVQLLYFLTSRRRHFPSDRTNELGLIFACQSPAFSNSTSSGSLRAGHSVAGNLALISPHDGLTIYKWTSQHHDPTFHISSILTSEILQDVSVEAYQEYVHTFFHLMCTLGLDFSTVHGHHGQSVDLLHVQHIYLNHLLIFCFCLELKDTHLGPLTNSFARSPSAATIKDDKDEKASIASTVSNSSTTSDNGIGS